MKRNKKSPLVNFVETVLPKQKPKNRGKKIALGGIVGAGLAAAVATLTKKDEV